MMQMSAALIMSWSSIVTWPTNADTRAESVLPFQVIMYVERHDNALGVCMCVREHDSVYHLLIACVALAWNVDISTIQHSASPRQSKSIRGVN